MVRGQGLISVRYLEPEETKSAKPERLIDIMPVGGDINVLWSVEFAITKSARSPFHRGVLEQISLICVPGPAWHASRRNPVIRTSD